MKEAWMLAIETLSWMEMQKLSTRLALAKTIKQLEIRNSNAIRFAYRLVQETVRRRNFIDKFIDDTLEFNSINRFDFGVQAFLRLYVYQTRIAKNWYAFNVEEAEKIVSLARSILGWRNLREVEHVLGLLLTKERDSVFVGVNDEDKIGLQTCHPSWFVRYCFKLFGRRETIAMLKANMRTPQTYLRLNTLMADEDEILERLSVNNIEVAKVEELEHTYVVVDSQKPLNRTEVFREGLITIQDKASCFTVEAADPKPGMTVLDVCAAPGAKTTYLAQLMDNDGLIYSIDYSRRRINLWKRQMVRMGANIAFPMIIDAYDMLPLNVQVDLVVLDPPCTSTGVFGKFPSAKWRLTRHSVNKMAKIQWSMLENCASSVKKSGVLVYSTCSITTEENEKLIERFLKWYPEFSVTEILPNLGNPGLRGFKKCQRLYPHIHHCNGFFIAKLVKKG